MRYQTLAKFCVFSSLLTWANAPVQAGFEWVPPAPAAEQAPQNYEESMPDMPAEQVGILPLVPQDLPPLEEETSAEDASAVMEYKEDKAHMTMQVKDMPAETTPVLRTKRIANDADTSGAQHKAHSSEKPQTLRMSNTLVEPENNVVAPAQDMDQERAPISLIKRPVAQAGTTTQSIDTVKEDSQQSVVSQEIAPSPQHNDDPLADMKAAMTDTVTFETVHGFGNDMPLALALQQVVPPSYAYSFGTDVNPGAAVSWNGGRAWDQVLSDMLASLKLKARMRGNTIVIVKNTESFEEAAVQQQITVSTSEAKSDKEIIFLDGSKGETLDDIDTASGDKKDMTGAPQNIEAQNPVAKRTVDRAIREVMAEGSQTYIQKTADKDLEAPEVKITSYKVRNTIKGLDEVQRQAIQDPGEMENEVQPVLAEAAEKRIKYITNANSGDLVIDPSPLENMQTLSSQTLDMEKTTWEARKGDSLKTVLEQWAKSSDTQLVWDASHDFKVPAHILVKGSLKDAITFLQNNAMAGGDYPMMDLYEKKADEKGSDILFVKERDPSSIQAG